MPLETGGGENAPFTSINVSGGVGARAIQSRIESTWRGLLDDPDARAEAIKLGVPAEVFTSGEIPFEAKPGGDRFLDPISVAIWLGATVAGWGVKKGLDVLWDRCFWPALSARFGAQVSAPAAASDTPEKPTNIS
jgi:hypothetical protein